MSRYPSLGFRAVNRFRSNRELIDAVVRDGERENESERENERERELERERESERIRERKREREN